MAVTDAILATLHFLSIFGVVATLVGELLLSRPALIAESGRMLWRVDIAYGVSAIAVIASGAARAVWGAKGWAFYAHNPVFHAKVGLFLLIGVISIWPTIAFLRWRRSFRDDPAYAVPLDDMRRTRRLVSMEVHLLVLLPVLATMMSRGLHF